MSVTLVSDRSTWAVGCVSVRPHMSVTLVSDRSTWAVGCVSVRPHMSVTLVSDRSTWAVGCVLYVLTCQLHWALTGRLGQWGVSYKSSHVSYTGL